MWHGCDTVELTTMLAAALPIAPLARLDARSALDILIIAILVYYLLKLLRGTRALQMLLYIAIALIILFQPEIRRALSRFGRNVSLMKFASHNPKAMHDDIVMAAEYFSQNRIGALMVVERQAGLRT